MRILFLFIFYISFATGFGQDEEVDIEYDNPYDLADHIVIELKYRCFLCNTEIIWDIDKYQTIQTINKIKIHDDLDGINFEDL